MAPRHLEHLPKSLRDNLWSHFPKPFFCVRAARLSLIHPPGQNHPLPVPPAMCIPKEQFPGCSHPPGVLHKGIARGLQRVAEDYQLTTSMWLLWRLESWVHKFGKHYIETYFSALLIFEECYCNHPVVYALKFLYCESYRYAKETKMPLIISTVGAI